MTRQEPTLDVSTLVVVGGHRKAVDFVAVTDKSENSAPFIGAWGLVSYELLLPSGVVEKPLGDHPLGRILYLENGQMSAQVVASELDPLADVDPREATLEEAARAWRNYVGYWGTFTVDVEAGVVVHAVDGAWFPNWGWAETSAPLPFFR